MKTTTFRTIGTVLLLLVSLNSALAQEVPPALQQLMKLEGHWEGRATLTLEGKSYTFRYHADFTKTADGSGLLMKEWFREAALGTLSGTNLIGYNVNDGKIHWFSVDNFGTTHDHVGVWKNPEHFFMQTSETMKQKKYVEKITMLFNANGTLSLTLVATLGGKAYENVQVVFERVAQCTNQ